MATAIKAIDLQAQLDALKAELKAENAAQLNALKAENEALQAKLAARTPQLSCKVSEKGGVSVYGLGRFPTTLYPEQWRKLKTYIPTVLEFIEDHTGELSWK